MPKPDDYPVHQCCGNCLYYAAGECRRLPPLPIHTPEDNNPTMYLTVFPDVDPDYTWCGEWRWEKE